MTSSGRTVRPASRGTGLVLLWSFAAFVVAMAFVASRTLGIEAAAWTQWFVRAMWLVAVYMVVLAAHESWRAAAQALRSLLRQVHRPQVTRRASVVQDNCKGLTT